MIGEVLEKLNIKDITKESFEILICCLKTILKYADNLISLAKWNAPVLPNLIKLAPKEIEFLKSEIKKSNFSIRECQLKVQKLINQKKRKEFSIYYTTEQGTKIMALVAKHLIQSENIILADPFLGSGLTLTRAIEELGVEKIQKVWGIEPLALPALVAYASLLHIMKGKKDVINVIVGDAFNEIYANSEFLKADVILTNPPFTRWKYLKKDYREFILLVMEKLGYKNYIIRKELGLHIPSMFLCDYILNDNGLLLSVLPASTFYTLYSRGFKSLLKEKYWIYAMIESKTRASFSKDSMFKEIIMVAFKNSKKEKTKFIHINSDFEKAINAIIDIHNLPKFLDINWLALFNSSKLRSILISIFQEGLENGKLGYWNDILGKDSIIRGIEMYGPEFFFIPNKYWEIIEKSENFVKIQNKNKELFIDKKFLVRTLRKPSLYKNKILADINTFMISIPSIEIDKLPTDLQEYIEWGVNSGTAKPAISAYGKFWYSHIQRQIINKKPFGNVFIPDKVDVLFNNRAVFANYTNEMVSASKNFYIIKCKDEIINKVLTGWFNSTIFISLLFLLSRKISETWTRFLEADYLQLPIINIKTLYNENKIIELVENVNNILDKDLPPFWKQLKEDYRYKLDILILELIGVKNAENLIKNLYQLLNNLFDKK